jgi:acetyl esterase/lipase
LVHGGAWYSGPDPNTTQGWHFGYTSNNNATDNIVLKMLNNGFVVVTMLYPLAAYGKENTEILANTTTVQTQMNSIDLAINHIRTNFPTCVNLNANSIQLLGESAGGHLALNWAYNSANTTYIKSVISCYAPTNMQQYGEYIRVKPYQFTCGATYYFTLNNNPPQNGVIHFPWYNPAYIDPLAVYNTFSPATCIAPNFPTYRILDLFNVIQSSYSQIISTPLTNSTLLTYSPYNALNSSKIIPTFIMHGSADLLVPYPNATNGMDTKLDNTGGLIFNYPNSGTGTSIPTVYSTLADKHGIKIYTGGNHGFGSGPFSLIRGDIIKWLNGHK